MATTDNKDDTVLDYLKPKKFRDRKTHHEQPELLSERKHARAKPYKREHLNFLLDNDEDSDEG